MITFDEGLARETGWYAVKNDVYYGPYAEEYEAELQLKDLRIQELEGILKRIIERQSVYSQDTFSPFSMGYDAGTKAAVDIARLAFEE